MDALRNQNTSRSGAVLPRVEETGFSHSGGGLVQICIFEDEYGRLATQFKMRSGQIRGCARGHLDSRTHRSRNRHESRCGVGDHLGASVRTSQHHVQRARRQMLGRQLREQQRALRGGVAGLEDDRVAAGQSRTDLPYSHHERVVPRRDLPDNPQRLSTDGRCEALHVLPGGGALLDPSRSAKKRS